MVRLECIPVEGDSMWPALRSGDAAFISKVDRAPAPGDVVVAHLGARFVIHRVQHVEADRVVLRGDNCIDADPSIAGTAVVGIVQEIRRGGRRLRGAEWDVGPRWTGRTRLWIKHTAARLFRRRA